MITTELPAELILLDPRTEEMFSLNATGAVVWRALTGRTTADLAEIVAAAFDVSPEVAEADVQALVEHLVESGLALGAPMQSGG